MGNIHTVGPNKVIVVSGSGGRNKIKVVSGGWVWVPKLSNYQFLNLNLMTLHPKCYEAETAEGVPISVSSTAQCKIMNTKELILIAAEQFLGRGDQEIEEAICFTLEGHLRSMLGTLTVEDIYKDREKFAHLVREVAAADVIKMGIQILSFTMNEIKDEVGYLASLGRTRLAIVQRDASIGVSLSERDASIKEAQCEKEANDIKCTSLASIENHAKQYKLEKSKFDTEMQTAKAEVQLTYELKEAKLKQMIRLEEVKIEIIERKKEIELEQKEVERKEKELISMVKVPAEAESYRLKQISEANKTKEIDISLGGSTKIKKQGETEGIVRKQVGVAEAERMYVRAIEFQKYGDAAIRSMILKKLPEIAKNICLPLSKTDQITLLSSDDGNDDDNLKEKMDVLLSQMTPQNVSLLKEISMSIKGNPKSDLLSNIIKYIGLLK